jgi:hypothetical protein
MRMGDSLNWFRIIKHRRLCVIDVESLDFVITKLVKISVYLLRHSDDMNCLELRAG